MYSRPRTLCTDPHWVGRADCQHCAVRAMMPFAPLHAEDLDQILSPIHEYELPAGTLLCTAGHVADSIVTVRRGFIKLQHATSEGNQRIVRLLRAGDVVGIEALQEGRYRHTAATLGDARVCRIPVGVVRQMEALRPELHASMTARWNASLAQADTVILRLLSGEASARVARFLCFLVDFAGSGPPPRLTRQDTAAILDLSPETVSRVSSAFILRGVLREHGSTFDVDRPALEKLAAN